MIDEAVRAAAKRCSRKRADGNPCQSVAVRGTDPPACRKHTGKSLARVRAEVAIREEVIRWGLGDTKVDPGELLLRLVTQSAIRAETYADELHRIVSEQGDLVKALTGNTYTATADGATVKTGEYVKAIVKLEAEERDRAAGFATKAIAAGLAERQVRMAERQADLAYQFIQAVLTELGMAGTPQATAAVQKHLAILRPAV